MSQHHPADAHPIAPSAPNAIEYQPAPTAIHAVQSEADLRTWLRVRNQIGDATITEEDVADLTRRIPRQLRLLGSIEDIPVGTALAIPDPRTPGTVLIHILVMPASRRRGLGATLFARVARWAIDEGCTSIQVICSASDAATAAFYARRGLGEVDRDAVVELDLTHGAPDVTPSRGPVTVVTLGSRPVLAQAVYEVGALTWRDIPSSAAAEEVVIDFEQWWDCVTRIPGCSPEHLFVALVDELVVGYAQLELPPGTPGSARNGFTGVLRSHRGRGVARALKVAQIAWAIEHGVQRIRTRNHEHNAPMRHLNRTLGYRPLEVVVTLRGTPLAAPAAARVVRVDRGESSVRTTDGAIIRTQMPAAQPLAVGDYVAVDTATDPPMIVSVQPARGVIARAVAGGTTARQVMASNVDVALVVCALDTAVNTRRIERFLAMTWQDGVRPVVVLTKADLLPATDVAAIATEVESSVGPGVSVVTISSKQDDGLPPIMEFLAPGVTAVLVGQSGAGKSTLVNRLLGRHALEVQAVRDDGKGRHTTTHRELLDLPNGAFVIDTPGIRELRLWDADDGISRTFADVEALAAQCRFGDCAHAGEPGCAVGAALEDGRLDPDRIASWDRLQREAQWLERRQDKAARSEARKVWRQRSRDIRHNPKQRR